MIGKILKRESEGELRLERRTLERRDLLIMKRNLCNGCGICAEVCPKGSVDIEPAERKNGRLLHFPLVHIDENTCIICGVCAVFCPLGALEGWVNDEKTVMFVQNEAVPQAIKIIEVDQEMCKPDCGVKCEQSCPRNAIEVMVQRENDQIQRIVSVQVKNELCIYCKACEYACPYGAISVDKFFEGTVSIKTDKCPENCRVCADICPSDAMAALKGGKVEVSQEVCIYCKACQNVCPKGAVHVTISRVSHEAIKSATWITLLERFASFQAAAKELAAKNRRKLLLTVESRAH